MLANVGVCNRMFNTCRSCNIDNCMCIIPYLGCLKMTNRNPLKTIFENKQRIKELEAQIKAIEEENQKCLEYALLKNIVERGDYRIKTVVTTRREPISSKVIAVIGNEKALQLAKFTVKDLEKLMGEDELTAICKVNESVKRVVEMIE